MPNVEGKNLTAALVSYAPGAKSPSHRHASSAFIFAYVLSGEIRSQVDGGEIKVYKVGETFFENPSSHHTVSENASETVPASLLAVFIVDAGDAALTTPD